MPVKFNRERLIGQGRQKRLFSREAVAPGRRMSPKRKLLIIYLGLLGATMSIVVLTQMSAKVQFVGRPLIYGAGEIVALEPEVEQLRVQLRILVAEDRSAYGWNSVPLESAEDLAVGDWVAARYRVSRNGYEVRIEACGLVALPRQSG